MSTVTSFYSYIKGISRKKIFTILMPIMVTVVLVAYVYTSARDVFLYNLAAIGVRQEGVGDGSDIAFSIYQLDRNRWIARAPAANNAMVTDTLSFAGSDSQVDIASTKTRALASWVNEKDGSQRIALSFWDAEQFQAGKSGWSEVVTPFDTAGENTQPTVQMRSKDDAIVVWVNNNARLLYSLWNGEYWSDPQAVYPEGLFATVSALQFAELFDKGALYTLSFVSDRKLVTAVFDGQTWTTEEVPQVQSAVSAPVLDASMDTGISQRVYHQVLSMSPNEVLHSVIASNEAGDAEQTFSDVQASRISVRGSSVYLLGLTPAGVLRDLLQEQTLDESAQTFDVTALYTDTPVSAVALWAPNKTTLSSAAYQTDIQKWSGGAVIDDDANAIDGIKLTAIDVSVSESQEVVREQVVPFVSVERCGDGVLDPPLGEECEIGVACASSAEICDWDMWAKGGKAIRQKLFVPICQCYPFSDTPQPPTDDSDGSNKKKDPARKDRLKPPGALDITRVPAPEGYWNGAACGFTSMFIGIWEQGAEEIQVDMIPESKTGGFYTFSKTGDNTWSVVSQTGTMAIFPDASDQPQAAVLLTFTPDRNTVTLTGINPEDGFQYCTGTLVKGAAPEGAGLMPARAE